ncbi:MAG TPA: helix-turn-helix transcriptional regulator [Micromonospora sp.]
MGQRPTFELFAGELRRMRQATNLSQETLAQRLRYSASLVAAIEQGRRVPSLDFTRRCDQVLETGGLLERIRDALTREALLPWFQEWVQVERAALALRSFEPLVIPGLLQTEEYARALNQGASQFSEHEMEEQVSARMARQAVLTRDDPPRLSFVLDEHVLRRPVGGAKVMREQLARLVEAGALWNVTIHVVPASVGAYPGLNGAFVVATPEVGDDVAYLDNQILGVVVDRAASVLKLRNIWESVHGEALSHAQSIKLITEAMETWT